MEENLDDYIDLFAKGTICNKPIFNCLGNHDIYNNDGIAIKKNSYNKINLALLTFNPHQITAT